MSNRTTSASGSPNSSPSRSIPSSSPFAFTPSSTVFVFGEHHTSTPRPTSASSTASGTPLFSFTPSSTPFAFSEAHASPPTFSFGNTPTSASSPVFTPSSTPFTLGAQHASPGTTSAANSTTSGTPRFTPASTPFMTELGNASASSPPAASSTTSGSLRFTPSSTPSAFGDGPDPDQPLPSIERDISSAGSRQNTPSTTVYTPSASTERASTHHSLEHDNLHQHLHNLTLASPEVQVRSPLQRDTPTPSIHVTPAPSVDGRSQPRASRADRLLTELNALHMGSSPGSGSPGGPGTGQSRSPSPSRRRRSGSGVNRVIHRIEDENPPDAVFHVREVQEALVSAKSVPSNMLNVLSASDLHREPGSVIESLRQQAMRLSAFQLPSSRIVGLVGDSGVGKSSLINSLLDKRDLARASNSGAACTCVVTEYHYHDRDDFVVLIDYFTLEELRRQYGELLRAYRDNESPPTDATREDRESLRRRADLARDTFRASFRERLEQTPTVLLSMPFDHAVNTMVEWASQLLGSRGRADGPAETQETINTAEGCSSRLRELTSELDNPDPNRAARACLWPFVRKLRVYLKAYILSKGLVIADLPGLRDLNSARQNVTERYVRQCHQILVVARIDRAITDQSIKDVFDLARRARLSNVGIVCTRSDDIQKREARADWPAERTRIDAMQRKIDAMQRKIDANTREIESLKEEIDDFGEDVMDLSEEDAREYARLLDDCRKAEKSRENNEFELRRHIITVRNDKVSRSVQDKYRSHPIAANPKTFCVSNRIYWSQREKPVSSALPYLQLSGILDLRRHCIGIVAESHLRATTEYIKDEIPAFLGSVALWVEAGFGNASTERKQQILEAVSTIQRELEELTSPVSQLGGISRALCTEFDTQVYLHLRQDVPQWSADARRASLCWQSWHHSSYAAFCRNYGTHQTKTMGYHCWNEEAIAGMNGNMSDVWDIFTRNLETHLDQIKNAIDQPLGTVFGVASCTGHAHNNTRSALRTLTGTLRHRKDLILYGVENAAEHFHSELSSLRTDAFSSIRTAFVGQLMEDTYHAANMEYGSGSDRRRKDLITNRFGSRSLFDSHRRFFKDRFRGIANELEAQVKESVDQQVALIETDLQMLRDENVVLESERNPEFRSRVAAEVDRARAQLDRIGRAVEDVVNAARGDADMTG